MKFIIQSIKTDDTTLRIYVNKPELYDRIYISELEYTPHDLYGAIIQSNNFLKNSEEIWIPIINDDIKNYDIVIERSILFENKDTFVVIKLLDKKREDL